MGSVRAICAVRVGTRALGSVVPVRDPGCTGCPCAVQTRPERPEASARFWEQQSWKSPGQFQEESFPGDILQTAQSRYQAVEHEGFEETDCTVFIDKVS